MTHIIIDRSPTIHVGLTVELARKISFHLEVFLSWKARSHININCVCICFRERGGKGNKDLGVKQNHCHVIRKHTTMSLIVCVLKSISFHIICIIISC